MILYIKKDCKNCENVKKYIKAVSFDIEIREIDEITRNEMIKQGAIEMPLLVDRENLLLSQGNKIIEYLINSEIPRKGKEC